MTVESNHTLLVIGHHHPDTDAVCSALAYASFYRWQTGQDAIACYLDDLAPETAWLLRHLGLEAPRAIDDVYLRVADVMETHVPVLRPDQTLREAGQLMQMHQVRALPVVDDANRLLGWFSATPWPRATSTCASCPKRSICRSASFSARLRPICWLGAPAGGPFRR